MKAVVLVGGISKWLYPLSHKKPRAMLQVGNVPALRHTLLNFKNWGVTEFYIPSDAGNLSLRDHFPEGTHDGITIRYAYTKRFLGTAGCLRLFQEVLSDHPFLIINGNSFSRLDLRPLLSPVESTVPFLRVGVYAQPGEAQPALPMQIPQTAVAGPSASPSSRLRRRPGPKRAHIYYAHPGIFQWIPKNRYFALGEQLVPQLSSHGCEVQDIPLSGAINELRSFEDYLEANHEIARTLPPKTEMTARTVRISRTATLHGPVMVGENTTIGAHCVIVGPTVIGDNCNIGPGVVIHRSVIESDVRIRGNSHLQKSIVLQGTDIPRYSHLLKRISLNGSRFPSVHHQLFKSSSVRRGWGIHHATRKVTPLLQRRRSRSAPNYSMKRALDIGATLLVSPILVPVFLVLGALVKLTSAGPMIYKEIRLGQHGKEFTLYKLRTMVPDAHKQQEQFEAIKQGDGPMFKLEKDPRVTTLGHWLRKTSLDELPQFWNVLKGDMSLVGPRPLADREMKWNPSWKELRLLVKPGITGLWQVKTGIYSDFSEWITYDVRYVHNNTMWLDLKILFATLALVVKGRG